jgi:hypothetical protein
MTAEEFVVQLLQEEKEKNARLSEKLEKSEGRIKELTQKREITETLLETFCLNAEKNAFGISSYIGFEKGAADLIEALQSIGIVIKDKVV